MRKIILGCAMSLDGYIARPNGSVDFLVMPKDGSKIMAEFFSKIDTVIFGRKTLDAAAALGGAPKGHWTTYVFSRSLPPGERDGMIFVDQPPADLVRDLRKVRGKHIFHMGGGELARSFLEADLVDELSLSLVPILLGEGIPLFPRGFPQRDFELIENKTHSPGLVSLTYQRIRPKPV
jgi:dihydrofolate reductase